MMMMMMIISLRTVAKHHWFEVKMTGFIPVTLKRDKKTVIIVIRYRYITVYTFYSYMKLCLTEFSFENDTKHSD